MRVQSAVSRTSRATLYNVTTNGTTEVNTVLFMLIIIRPISQRQHVLTMLRLA